MEMRTAVPINLEASLRNKLLRFSRASNVSPKLRVRSKIVLLASEAEMGLAGIEKDKTRPGRIKALPKSKESEIIRMTLEETPKGCTHWSRSLMAAEVGVSESTVGRVRTFKLSNDKLFEEKLEDIVGLYLAPPEVTD